MLGKGVCALSFALGPDNFGSNKTARVFSAVKTSCLFAGRNFQGIFNDCVTKIRTIFEWHCMPTVQPLGEVVWLASGCFPALPSVRRQGGDEWVVGLVPFSSQKVLMLKSKHFLCQRPVTKPVISLLGRLAGWWILHVVLRVRIWWGCCLMLEFQTQTVGENTNVWALTLLLFSHRCSGEAPLLSALISSFALDLLLFLFEEALGPKINWGPCVQLAERGTTA